MLNYSMLYPVENAFRRKVSLDGMWRFSFDPEEKGMPRGWNRGLPKSVPMPVPGSFADVFCDKESREYTGDFWYETDFLVPGEWAERDIALRFSSVTHRAVVFVNGVKLQTHEGGFLPFVVSITDVVKLNAMNKLVVKVNNELSEETLPCGTVTKRRSDGKKINRPYFDFFNYSGIQRSVYLTATPKESIIDYSVIHAIDGTTASVSYAITTTGQNDVQVSLTDEDGRMVALGSGKRGVLMVKNVRLWQVRNAYLYTLTIKIASGAHLIDEYSEKIGIRTVKIDGEKILINGESVYLKGFGKHEDFPILGRAYNPAVAKRDFELMKWIGANSFRTSHYPYAEEMYRMADEEGFLVIDEVPAVGMLRSIVNFLAASRGAETSFFDSDTIPALREVHKHQVEEMILRDKNHACVIAWSLMNEPETTNDACVPYFDEIFSHARNLDPQVRPCTFAMVMTSRPDTCKCHQFADFLCLNRYYGWYAMGGADMPDAMEAFRAEMDAWAQKNLNKPFIFTEYGADTLSSEHKLPSVMWSQEYQREYYEACHALFDEYSFIRGEQVWNFADFQTGEGINRVNGNKKGIFTRDRQPKDIAYALKQRWETGETKGTEGPRFS